MKKTTLLTLIMITASFPLIVLANWEFTGNLIIPPICQLAEENPLQVSFGKIGIQKIDGDAFRRQIPFTLNCNKNTHPLWDVKLTFSGNLAGRGFDDSTLYTQTLKNNGKIGIKIQVDGVPQPLNKPFSININAPPIISAVPVKLANTNLIADEFTASGYLTIDFQ
ncbi:fimbrial protein [Providencia vermicola]|uniref:fimbrial protein n=1 Tax=Providencia vermicola TaxID=333965 RepID=UPI0034D7589D